MPGATTSIDPFGVNEVKNSEMCSFGDYIKK